MGSDPGKSGPAGPAETERAASSSLVSPTLGPKQVLDSVQDITANDGKPKSLKDGDQKGAAEERHHADMHGTPVPSNRSAAAMADAIQDFMRRLPRDRMNFLLIDEAQSFYLMERPVSGDGLPHGSTLDVTAGLYMRR
ncbi:hypothetical protein TSOC_012805 [Tetrabaena socialis]|uniref:Uncharacterized protein n=1 Tax=Tetrabaena socialis TaxID=47790 RepID=A0A2J7ZM27_9CHLO|nr:hypothetical protein TSOC_012805 [Tetrabaena socialis]|eukprot:PNH01321.1 hypothetical protein TSOC_012805 [Tetrabaena socialis]